MILLYPNVGKSPNFKFDSSIPFLLRRTIILLIVVFWTWFFYLVFEHDWMKTFLFSVSYYGLNGNVWLVWWFHVTTTRELQTFFLLGRIFWNESRPSILPEYKKIYRAVGQWLQLWSVDHYWALNEHPDREKPGLLRNQSGSLRYMTYQQPR